MNKTIHYEIIDPEVKSQFTADFKVILRNLNFNAIPKGISAVLSMTFEGNSLLSYNVNTRRIVFKPSSSNQKVPSFVEPISEEQYKLVAGE